MLVSIRSSLRSSLLNQQNIPVYTMKRVLPSIFSIFLLASCAPSPALQTSIASPQPIPTSTTTSIPIVILQATSTTLPPTQTNTPTRVLCNPLTADFCITDGHFLLQRPIHPPANDSVDRTYPYASTANGTRDPHRGVEFINAFGTPVYAAGEGVVIFAGPDDDAIYSPWQNYYGNLVVIQHDNNLFTLYAHLSKIDIDAGDAVQEGDKIGEVGSSGVAIGSHLHFEVRRGAVEDYFSTENPELWLIPRQSFGAISLSILDANSTFQRSAITVQQYSSSDEVVGLYYLNTYHPQLTNGEENAAIGDLEEGRYRISLIYNGYLYERWVDVESGKLTQVVIVVK